MQGRVLKIPRKKIKLFDERLLHGERRGSEGSHRSLRKQDVHADFWSFVPLLLLIQFLRNAATSAPFLNGP